MKILKNYFYTFGYQIFAIIVPLITSPYITRVLGPKNFGISSFVSANVQYFVLFATLGLTTYGQRSIAYVQNDIRKRSKVFWEIEFLSVFINVIVSIVFFIYSFFINPTNKSYYLASYALILAVGFDISWYFSGMEKFNVVVTRNFIIKIITIISIFSLVKTKNDLLIYLIILAISSFIGNVLLWPYLKNEIKFINLKKLNPFIHFKETLILFIPQITSTFYIVLNKIILGYMCGDTQTGYFDNADKIIKIATTVVTSISTVVMPQVALAFVNKNQHKINTLLIKSINFVLLVCTPMMLGLIAISTPFSVWFFGSNYKAVGSIMAIEALAIIPIGCSVILTQQFLVPVKKISVYNKAVFIGALINIAIGWILNMQYQAKGTAVATVITELFVTLIEIKYISRFISIKKIFKEFPKYIIASLIMFIVIITITNFMRFSIITLILDVVIGIIVYSIIIYYLNPQILDDIKMIIAKFKEKYFE